MRSNGLQVVRNADMVGGLLLSASASFTRINLHRLIPSPRLLRVHTSVTSSSGCAIGNPPLPLELLILSRDAGCKRVLMLSVSASTRSVDSICTKNPIPSHRSADSVDCRRKNRLCAYAAAYLFAALPHAPLLLLQHRLRVGESYAPGAVNLQVALGAVNLGSSERLPQELHERAGAARNQQRRGVPSNKLC